MNQIHRDELLRNVETELQVAKFRDYCPNGLQVEGKSHIKKIVTGVTANLSLLQAAIEVGADAILVHHGYFWRGEDARIIGAKAKRMKLLLNHDVNLIAYHLPLDSHPSLGNNIALAELLGWVPDGRFGENDIGWLGYSSQVDITSVGALTNLISEKLGRTALLIGDQSQPFKRIAWCTGAAHTMLDAAIAAGADVFVSGEISEPIVHLARESGVAYIAAGHHATERYGIQRLGNWIAATMGIEHEYIDIPNPV